MYDPYHKWLGIPPAEQPPTLYRLLGISSGEQDREVIEEAALRQTAHVRTYQIGPNAAEATRILNEIAKARTILTNTAKRASYDASLRQPETSLEPSVDLVPTGPPPLPMMPPLAYAPGAPVLDESPPVAPAWDMSEPESSAEPLVKVSRKQFRGDSSMVPWIVVLGLVAIGMAVAGYFALAPESSKGKDRAPKNRKTAARSPDSSDTTSGGALRTSRKKTEEAADEVDVAAGPLGEGWDRLFNGKDLTGWEPRLQDKSVPIKQAFFVDSAGLLTFDGATRGLMESSDRFKDFELRVEFRFPDMGRTEPRYSSAGIGFRTLADDPFNANESLEVALGLKDLGNFMTKGVALMTAKGAANPANQGIRRAFKQVPPRTGRWNVLDLTVMGGKITLKINNQIVNEGSNAPQVSSPLRLIYRGTAIQFRTIAIKRQD